MKKNLFFTLLICAALLTSCGKPDETIIVDLMTPDSSETHTHVSDGDWVCDFNSHWHLCECGEEMDKGAHTLEHVNCTVCGSEIVVWEDGSKEVTVYNDHGDNIQFTSYAPDGSVETDERLDFVYDDAGNMISMEAYLNGFRYAGYEYAVGSDGETHIAGHTTYNEDGTYKVDTYDEDFHTLRTVHYAADNSITTESRYLYNEDFSRMTEEEYLRGEPVAVREYMLDEYTAWLLLSDLLYNGEGNDIARTYDDSGNPLTEVHYNPQGGVELEYSFENTYDLSGNLLHVRIFKSGVFVEETTNIN